MNKPDPDFANAMTRSRAGFNRRNFLRGLGACVALPMFESLAPARLFAAGKPLPAAANTPVRSAFIYFPNGAIPSAWWPKEKGAEYEMTRTLEPLASLRPHIQLLGGLDHRNALAGPDGAGDHARASGVFLTGVRVKKSATEVHGGTSIDQVIARQIAHSTRFPSLELTCEAERPTGSCDSGYACAYQFNISWSSPTTPMTPEANPRLVFERLFGEGAHGERAEHLKYRREQERSILDFVLEDARGLQKRLNGSDRDKLDQYLTGVRSIEARIQKAESLGDPKDPAMETPAGVPSSYAEHVQLMFDMLLLAFQTDSTRVATLALAHDGSNRSFAEIGIPEGHHDLSHHFGNAEKIRKVSDIDLWYVKQFARFIERLRDTPDSDGKSLLHNSMILYGSGNADGNAHTHLNLPLILAGNGGGTLSPGRYTRFDSVPASNLFLSMADRMGVQGLERFGDSTSRLKSI